MGCSGDAGRVDDAGVPLGDDAAPPIASADASHDGTASGDDSGTVASDASSSSSGALKTVFVILMENHNWSQIKGSASAPYINKTLLPMASHAENYFDNPKKVHPSEPNYIWIEAGDNLGITDDADPSSNHQATTDHLVTQLANAGVSWRSYQENIDGKSCPIVSGGLYGAKHNPMVFFDDIVGKPPSASNAGCIEHVRPYGELAADLAGNKVARYNFLTPNLCNDMHNSSGCATNDAVKNGDTWLSNEVPKLLASQAYLDGGVVFITWDESEKGEFPIGMIVLSPKAKGGGYSNTTKYFHSSLTRSVEEIFGITTFLRDAANQSDLGDLFVSFP
jgi:hypothetical protein